ncbi:MAG: hypothetical protein PHW22_00385 [Bacilli bacterium]|nr:hypothetical protein [Bacilli bacterium]
MTLALNEEDIKKMFVKAYNEMIRNKEDVLANFEKVLNEVTRMKRYEKEIFAFTMSLNSFLSYSPYA